MNRNSMFRIGPCICLGLFAMVVLAADPPQWWTTRGVLNSESAQNSAAANQGQLKHIASKAAEEFQEKIPQAVGLSDITTMTDEFTEDYNLVAVNIGQLKYVAKPFYDVLNNNGLQDAYPDGMTGPYPWTVGDTSDDEDNALANLGQLKYVFSFDLDAVDSDGDGDGMPDWWEIAYDLDPQSDSGDDGADGDPDDDGLDNYTEYVYHTNPRDMDSDDDGLKDGVEYNLSVSIEQNGSGGVWVLVPGTGHYHVTDPDLKVVYLGAE